MFSSRALGHSHTPDFGEKSHLNPQTLDQAYIPVANMPGPMSYAGATVGNALLTGWSNTTASVPSTGTTSVLTGGTGVETTDSAQMYTSQFFGPPAAVFHKQSSSAAVAVSDPEPYQQQPGPDLGRQASLLENFYAGGTLISATLPRGFRRSEGCSRLSMGVTPRPFGAKPSKVASLPRAYVVSPVFTSSPMFLMRLIIAASVFS